MLVRLFLKLDLQILNCLLDTRDWDVNLNTQLFEGGVGPGFHSNHCQPFLPGLLTFSTVVVCQEFSLWRIIIELLGI